MECCRLESLDGITIDAILFFKKKHGIVDPPSRRTSKSHYISKLKFLQKNAGFNHGIFEGNVRDECKLHFKLNTSHENKIVPTS